MSVTVRAAEESDIAAVCDLLHANMSSKISRERWRNLLDYPWRPPDAPRGCVAIDGERVVGFLGLVYADRTLDGAVHRTCNICAWYLLRDYRGMGLGRRIRDASVADGGITYTILTATEATGRAFRAAGFHVLDGERSIVRRRSGGTEIEALDDQNAIAARLDGRERRILEEHRGYNVRHFLFRSGESASYVVLQVKRKGDDIDYHELLYSGDGGFLATHAQAIANTLLPSDRAVLAFDLRFVPDGSRFEREAMRLPRWYRSAAVRREAVDHLYSEIVLLDLKL
jgi:GNAT superfamily N-acetyltransferase